MDERRTVFISHANPEDNDFATWLGSKLASVGYDVWADVLSLVGGEMVSPVIDDVIRDRATIVIVALSRASHRKDGVLNEVALASKVARQLRMPGFLLPIVLDDLPASDFPADLVRPLCIDFSQDWANGLGKVLDALEKRATPGIECRHRAMAAWLALKACGSKLRVGERDLLYSNWFRLGSPPTRIHFSRFSPGSDIDRAFGLFRSPARPFHRLAISFANAQALMAEAPSVRLEPAYNVELDSFLAGERKEGASQVLRTDARNILTALLNQAWDRFARDRGLLPREFVAGNAWFVPLGLFDKDRGVFTDEGGKRRRRQLAGRSETRAVNWHFAVSAKVTISNPCYFALRSHVVFTEDGHTPIEDDRSKRLRRSFCKNWWNSRWRDMLRAFVATLADGCTQVELPLGPGSPVSMATVPMRFKAPVWVEDDESLSQGLTTGLEDDRYDGFEEDNEAEGYS